jgi:hypothetical protein
VEWIDAFFIFKVVMTPGIENMAVVSKKYGPFDPGLLTFKIRLNHP